MVKGGGTKQTLLYPLSKVNPFLYYFRVFLMDILEFQFEMEFKLIHQDPRLGLLY
jgi:hypothetical protein